MEIPKQGTDDESCNGSDDLVEYTLDEQEEQEDVHPSSMDELEELVEVSSIPDVQDDEEMCVEMDNVKEVIYDSLIPRDSANIPDVKCNKKIMMQPQSSSSYGTMKLLNSTQNAVSSTAPTTSYRLVNTDGTMIMNVPATQQQTTTKIISIGKPTIIQKSNAKVTLNHNARVLHIQPSYTPATTGNVMKTVTITKNAVAMKPISASAIKPHIATTTPSVLQKPFVHVTKPSGQGLTIAPHRIINSTNGGKDEVIIKSNNTPPTKKVSTSNIQQRSVSGIKGLQYVRVLNNRVSQGSGTTSKMILQSINKIPASNLSASAEGSANTQVQASKIVLQNNRTYVVRNAVGTMGTSTSSATGNPSLAPITRKIILGGTNVKSLDKFIPTTTRIVIKKDVDPKRTLAAKQPLSITSINSVVNEANIRIEDAHQRQELQKSETISTRQTSMDDTNEIDADTPKTSAAYGFPEEAYKKRPCNCTKSQCLKLYCDCFANGEFCYNCNCKDCYNTFDHETERQKAIRCTLERNPNAFKPKIGSVGPADEGTRLHTKGCNCKRSGCLKNYCECYEAKIPCSSNCKCVGCRNTDQFAQEFNYFGIPETAAKTNDDSTRVTGKSSVVYSNSGISSEGGGQFASSSVASGMKRTASFIDADISELPAAKQPHNFMTLDVIEATVQCMVAQADECLKRGCSIRTSERMILEEYGRCLLEIKEFAFKTEN